MQETKFPILERKILTVVLKTASHLKMKYYKNFDFVNYFILII